MLNNYKENMENKNISKWIIPVLCVVGLSSCLKNKNEQPDFSATTPVVELPVNSPMGDGSVNSLSTSLTQSDTPSTYSFYVNYAASSTKATDINVTLSVSPSSIDNYNAAHSDDEPIVIMPPAAYTMPTTVTIPAGQRRVQVPIKAISKLLDPNFTYGIPVTITDASGEVISKNFASLVIKVAVKNMYDGVYSYKGYIFREGDPVKTGNFTKLESSLETNGANGLMFTNPVWADLGGVGGIGGLTINVDPATKKVTMKSKDNATLVNAPGYDNRYDATTKTFYLSFKWGASPNSRAATDTLTYIRPR
jgi:hypothetical protein